MSGSKATSNATKSACEDKVALLQSQLEYLKNRTEKDDKKAEDLVARKGVLSINNNNDFRQTLQKLIDNPKLIENAGKSNYDYIGNHKGASIQIIEFVKKLLSTKMA